MERLMDFAALMENETNTRQATWDYWGGEGGFLDRYPGFIDLAFVLIYNVGPNPSASEEDAWYGLLARSVYWELPYNLRSVIRLWESGYYSETILLLRQLMECLVKLQFFATRKSQVEKHCNGTQRVTFKKMFEALGAEMLYREDYSLHSEFAHAGIGRVLFRFEGERPDVNVMLGPKFRENDSSFHMNYLNLLLYGFINRFEFYFPLQTLSEEQAELKTQTADWLSFCMRDLQKLHPKTNPLVTRWAPLVGTDILLPASPPVTTT